MARIGNLVAMACLLAAGGLAAAESRDEPIRAGSDFRSRPVRKTGMRFRKDIEAWVKSLKLPKDQEKQVLDQLKRQRDEQEALEKAHARQVAELQKQTDDLRKREGELRKEMEKLQKEQAKVNQPQAVQPESLLTAQQLREWEGHKLARSMLHEYREAHLTDDQQEKVRSLCESPARKLADAPPAERGELTGRARQDLTGRIDKLLNDDQRQSMETQRISDDALRSMRAIQLTNEQYEKIGKICSAAVRTWHRRPGENDKAAREWNNFLKERDGFLNGVVQEVRKDVLTREQRQQLDTPRPKDQLRP